MAARIFALALAGFALAACASPCPPNPSMTGPIVTRYDCERPNVFGQTETPDDYFVVTFTRDPDQATVEQPGYEPVTLRAQVTGSGFRYASGGVELRGQGNEARLIRAGGGEQYCRSAN